MTTTPRRIAAGAIAVLAVLAMTGCTNPGTPSASPTSAAVAYPMPDLGLMPTPTPLTPDETEEARLTAQDERWQQVLTRYPAAIRPSIEFTEYLANEGRDEVRSECYSDAGLALESAVDATDGHVAAVSAIEEGEADAIAIFICDATHPGRPLPPASTAELGYLYDYLTEFLAPCFAANGIENPPPPSREDFIANWPQQGWFPTLGDTVDGPEREAEVNAACPPLQVREG